VIDFRHIFRNIIVPGAFRIPKTVSVNGSIEASVSGRIDGTVKGDVKTTGKLVISQTAMVRGHVYATDLVVQGKVYGDVYISNKAHISNKALVKGDVNAMTLEIEEGAVVGGAIRKNVLPPATGTAEPEETVTKVATPAESAAGDLNAEEQSTSWF
jgi:cytoskeletal protein CcmA (bactofilin family)